MNDRFFIAIFVAVVFIGGAVLYVLNPEPIEYKNPNEGSVVCTADAKLCPDGTYVGRTGSNCEFVCPAEATTTSETNSCASNGFCIGPKGGSQTI